MAVRSALKQPKEKCPEEPRWKGMNLLLLWKGRASQAGLPSGTKPSPAPGLICKGPYWRRDCPPRCRPQGLDSQDNQDWRCPGVPTQAPVLVTPEEPRVLITVEGQSIFSFGHWGNFLLTKASGLLSWSTTINGAVWTSQIFFNHWFEGCFLELSLC